MNVVRRRRLRSILRGQNASVADLVSALLRPAVFGALVVLLTNNLTLDGDGSFVIGVIASGQTEIRWSPTCQAAWLRQNNQTFAYAGTLELYTYYKDYYNGSYYGGFSMKMPAGHNGNWTKMVPMSTPMYAQAHINLYWSGLYNTN